MKNTFVKVLSFMMALTMIVGAFSAITVSAAECAHENKTVIDTVDATCVKVGFTKYHCDDCGEEFIGDVEAATGKHTYVTVDATEATCDAPAYNAYEKCSVCGTENPDNKKTINTAINEGKKLEHVWHLDVEVAATCTTDGYKSKKCQRCGVVDDKLVANGGNKVITKVAAHEYKYEVITAPGTCTNGSYKVTCKNCDYTATIADGDKKHTEVTAAWGAEVELAGEGKVKVGSGCNAKYKSLKYCSVCKVKIEGELNDNLGHLGRKIITGSDAGKLTADDINEKIINHTGLNIGDPTFVGRTCSEDGYRLRYCVACDHYYLETLESYQDENNGEHRWRITRVPAADHTQPTIDRYTCRECAGVTKDVVVAEGTPHNYKNADGTDSKAVTPMGCTTNGYTTWTCTVEGCTHSYTSDIVYAAGHDWSDWTFASKATAANDEGCTSTAATAMVRTCKNEDCSGVFGTVNDKDWGLTTQKSNQTKHTYEVVTTAATCQADAFSENVCKNCGYNAGKTGVTQPAAGKNPNNHVVKDNATTAGTKLEVTQAATCTRVEKANYKCACGTMVNVISGAKIAHTYVVGGKYKVNNTVVKDFSAKTPDCNSKGQTAGELCTVCGDVKTAPTSLDIVATAHTYDEEAPLDVVAATCTAKAATRYYCTDCKTIVSITTGAAVDATNHPNATKTNAVAATCLATGMEAYYYCADCKKYMAAGATSYDASTAADTLEALDLVIPMLSDVSGMVKGQHNWGAATTAVAEQCTVTGKKSYQVCRSEDCGAWLVDGVVVFDNASTKDKDERVVAITIAAHGNAYIKNMSYLNGVATCTKGAYMFIPNTLLCEKCGSNGSDGKNFKTEFWQEKTDHDYVWVADKTAGYVKQYNITKTTGIQSTAKDCTKATFSVEVCTVCNAQWVEGYNATGVKAAHVYKNDKGEYIDKNPVVVGATCTTAGYKEYKCQNCTTRVKVTTDAATDHYTMVNGTQVAISFLCADLAANAGLKCYGGCGKTVNADPTKGEVTVKHNEVKSEKAATCTEDGYSVKYCADCNEIITSTTTNKLDHAPSTVVETVDGIETLSCPRCKELWTKTVDATVVDSLSANKIAAGETVTYTYTVVGTPVSFSAMDIDVKYDAAKLTLVGVTANADLAGLNAFAATKVESGVNYVGVSLVVANDAEGNAQKVTTAVEGTVLFTLEFQAKKTASGVAKVDDKEVAITSVGNLNGDAIVTAADAQAIFAQIGTNNAAADVNNDGIVNLADVAALATFAASGKTAKDYLVMAGEYAKIEAEVYALLDAGRLANHDSVNSVINVNDALALIAKIDAKLAYGYANLGDNVTAAAVVAYYNAYSNVQ